MNPERWRKVRGLFEEASKLPAQEVAGFLSKACGEDQELLGELEGMLAVDAKSPKFLKPPTLYDEAPPSGFDPSSAPRHIGEYQIIRTIAVGGMGVVYEAQQENPQRLVALKMLQASFVSSSVARRFQHETEILARLRHPGIAQIYAAGVHGGEDGAGVPYFAMEFVKGSQDILTYADGENLNLRERLGLFIEVCDAVHYGHQQGVIHRDLKPANILVDESGHAKVIDFGVARVTDADVALNTLVTRTGELIGTLRYMSPEQFSGDPHLIDTRCDVYALGYVLYELLCGAPPYETDGKPMTEVARIIRNVAPRDPRRVMASLPEDLGWVLLRALEKERERRYASASEMAADLARFMDHQPVQAGPPSTIYRARKFVRRNRLAVGALSVVALALLAGTVVATTGLLRAADEAQKFRSINGVLTDVLVSVRTDRDGRDVKVADMLDRSAEQIGDRLAGRPEIEGALRQALTMSYDSLGLMAEAAEQARRALELWEPILARDDPERLATIEVLVNSLVKLDEYEEAKRWMEEGLDSVPDVGEADPFVLTLRNSECNMLILQGLYAEAASRLRGLHQLAVDTLGESHPKTLSLLASLVRSLRFIASDDELEQLSRRLLAATESVAEPMSYDVLSRKLSLAGVLMLRGKMDEAESLYSESLNPMILLKGEEHNSVLTALNGLAILYGKTNREARALPLVKKIAEITERLMGPENSKTLTMKSNLAVAMARVGDLRGEQVLRETLAANRLVWGDDHPQTLTVLFNLGVGLANQGRYAEAEPLVIECYERSLATLGEDSELTLDAMHSRGALRQSMGDLEQAKPLLHEAWVATRRVLGPRHMMTMHAASDYVSALLDLGETAEALPIATELVDSMRGQVSPGNPRLITVLSNLARLHMRQHNLASAEDIYRQALDQVLEYMDPKDAWVSKANDNLAVCLLARGETEGALEYSEAAVAASELNTAVSRAEYALYRRTCGRSLEALGLVEEALSELSISYEVLRGQPGAGHANLNSVIRDLVRVCEALGDPEQAEAWRAKLVAAN